MSPNTHGSRISKRPRTVEGSCWPCKQRRVKCDLEKPSCSRCVANGSDRCSYEKVLLRWKQSPARGVPAIQPTISDGLSLPVSERRAIEYFKNRLWPLFSTVHEPCPPPVALALRSQPVLQALCVFAEEHRALQRTENQLLTKDVFERRRLQCLTVIRSHLDNNDAATSLPALLVAVLLLYFLEGYVNCTQDDASTQCHLAGALAIIDALGGFEAAWSSSDRVARMLLSELASTDLTDSILQDRKPSFPISIWKQMDSTSDVWWESLPGTKSLANILETIAEMSFCRHDLFYGAEANNEKLLRFERSLQPVYSMLEFCSDDVPATNIGLEHDLLSPAAMASSSLNRTFQHAGLIYLYRALRNIPIKHFLVQQHVHACLGCVQSMESSTRTRNCTLFPLYVAGAHAVVDHHRDQVLEALNIIYNNLQFESVRSIRATLQQMWHPSEDATTWSDLFKGAAPCTLVI